MVPHNDPEYRCEQWMRGDTMNSFHILFGCEIEDYCDANLLPKRIHRGLWHWHRGVSRNDYVRACHEYIQTATELIDRRGKRMMREVVRRGLQTVN